VYSWVPKDHIYLCRKLSRYSHSLWAGRSEDRIPVGATFSAPVQTGRGAHPASYTMGTGSFLGVKRPGRGVDHPPSSSAEVKERVELYLYSSSGPSWPVTGWSYVWHCRQRDMSSALLTQLTNVHICFTVIVFCKFIWWLGGGHAVGWGTALQAERSRVSFPKLSLEFFIDIILPAALWSWGPLSL
jgi:hypothetical protein